MFKKFKKLVKPFIAATAASLALAVATPVAFAEEKADHSDKKIYFLSKLLGNQYWSVIEEGASKAAEELGVELVITGLQNESEVEKQVQQLQDAVSANASAIVVGPTDSTAMANPVKEAYESGIPVVVVDTMVNTDGYTLALMTDNYEAGRTAAEEMLRLFKEQGISEDEEAQIAIQIGSSGSQTTNDRMDGFNDYWNENAPEKWTVLNDDIKVNDGDITKAVSFTQDFLTAYPNLKAVFGPNNGSTVGFVTGIQEAGRDDIILVGFDFSAEIENMIRKGEYTVSTIVQRQYFMGYNGIKEAVALADGKEVKEDEKEIDTGVLVVNGENIDDEDVQEVINPTVE